MLKVFILAIILISSAFASDDQFYCDVFSSDDLTKELPYSIDIMNRYTDGQYKLTFSNYKGGLEHRSWHFDLQGDVNRKVIEVQAPLTGQEARWTDETEYQSVWTPVEANVQGRISAKKIKHKKLGKGIIGEAVLPFINEGRPVTIRCNLQGTGDFCGWFCT